jgi:uncharacterized protein
VKIKLDEIPPEGKALEVSERVSVENVVTDAEAGGSLFFQKITDEILVNGEITCRATLTCSRCLKEFVEESMIIPVNLVYLPVKAETEEKKELSGDELEVCFYDGDELDVSALVKEQAILGLPMKIVCSEDCKGLCPHCGADLNEGGCDCQREAAGKATRKLGDFFKKSMN